MLQIGSILDRKYRILDVIGQGGMSIIYLARNDKANKYWAIKEVRKEGVIDEQANLAGLIAETDLLKELHHPNIVSIVDVIDQEDSFIIVMDLVEGRDLKEVLSAEGAQPTDKVRKWALQICDIFSYLHSQKPPIVYRDLKPNNLMLTPKEDVILIDFGTARRYKYASQADDTKPLGTIGYAAPEQYGGYGETDARTDIYTIGATLFHLLTGKCPADPPYYEVTLLRRVDPIFEDTGWEYIINKCCQKRREDRYQSVEELRYDLEHIDEMGAEQARRRRKHWRLFVASVVLCLLGAAGIVGFRLALNKASSATYDSNISSAEAAASIREAESYYKAALRVDPGRPEAYNSLEKAISSDGRLTDDEMPVLSSCLNETNGGTRANIAYLQNRNPATYDVLMYKLGLMHFFMHDRNANDMKNAAGYFSLVTSSGNLTAPQRMLASCLERIGSYYGSLGTANRLYYMEDISYMGLWRDLCEMVSGDVVEKVGGKAYCVALYNQMAYQIFINYSFFNEEGVTQQEMITQLNLAEDGLNAIQGSDRALQAERQAALDMVSSARSAVASYFDRKG